MVVHAGPSGSTTALSVKLFVERIEFSTGGIIGLVPFEVELLIILLPWFLFVVGIGLTQVAGFDAFIVDDGHV